MQSSHFWFLFCCIYHNLNSRMLKWEEISPTMYQIKIYPCIFFPILKSFFSITKQIIYRGTSSFKQNYLASIFFTVIKCSLSQHCQSMQLKTFNLQLNVSLISNKSPNLHSNFSWNEYCFSHKQKTTVKGEG